MVEVTMKTAGDHGDDHSGQRHDPRRRADDDRLFGGLGEARRIGDHLADLDPTIEIDFMPETAHRRAASMPRMRAPHRL
ncbi:MAG: hypothetical protein IPK17_18080 [Chloroflexi bacterium]|uniref:hypothetical protein n=1 Tax=Candidatus Flexifilum breve TaxID=3140694 RepID=UPI003134920A|nr:hypothetical protein [Chloroflexota bacterium]